jgi:integrase/recombinase XerD
MNSPLEVIIQNYQEELIIVKGKSINTVNAYLSDIKQFIKQQKINQIDQINSGIIIDYIVGYKNSIRSLSRKITSIKAFLVYLELEGIIESGIREKIKMPKYSSSLPKALEQTTMLELLDNLPHQSPLEYRNLVIFEVLYQTGMRISELIELELNDVKFSSALILVNGKNNKQRGCILNEHLAELIKEYIENYRIKIPTRNKINSLFINYRGDKLTRQSVWRMIKKETYKINPNIQIHPHTFRHSYGTHLLENGASMRYIQAMLGHENLSTTQVYMKVSDKYLEEQYRKFHPRRKEKNEK